MEAGLPNIIGTTDTRIPQYSSWGPNGAFFSSTKRVPSASFSETSRGDFDMYTLLFRASDSNAIYGNSTTVQPASLTAIYAIKY